MAAVNEALATELELLQGIFFDGEGLEIEQAIEVR